MTSNLYTYEPSIFSQRKNSLIKDFSVYARMDINRFASSAIYKCASTHLVIKQNGYFFPKSYKIFKRLTNEKELAIYSFVSLKDLPNGKIQFISGQTYFIKEYAHKSYDVIFENEIIGCFNTISSNSLFNNPSLEVKMKPANIENFLDYEVILFSVWFTMITVGMGLQDG